MKKPKAKTKAKKTPARKVAKKAVKKTSSAKKPAAKKATTKSAPVTATFVPKRSKDVLFRKNTDGTVAIMKLDRDDFFFTVDGICAELWLKMDGKLSVGKMVSDAAKKYGAPEQRLTKDITRFLADLRKEQLIT